MQHTAVNIRTSEYFRKGAQELVYSDSAACSSEFLCSLDFVGGCTASCISLMFFTGKRCPTATQDPRSRSAQVKMAASESEVDIYLRVESKDGQANWIIMFLKIPCDEKCHALKTLL